MKSAARSLVVASEASISRVDDFDGGESRYRALHIRALVWAFARRQRLLEPKRNLSLDSHHGHPARRYLRSILEHQ
jgi:hypothetical protein